jgi:polyisoprenoid-binding protein YceI
MNLSTKPLPPPPSKLPTQPQPTVDLRISGKGLMLSGAFRGWQSRLVLGPDLDEVGLTLFVDVTSVRAANDARPCEDLFAFRSRSVESLGKGRFRVIGDFTGAEATRELSVDVETPLGHTPLIALSFSADRKDFGARWQSLVENATLLGKAPDDDGPQREAAAWLTVPNIAAA